jgi:hypothetical protein
MGLEAVVVIEDLELFTGLLNIGAGSRLVPGEALLFGKGILGQA